MLPEARAQVDALVRLMNLARAADIPIFYARADHRPDGKDGATAITDLELSRAERPTSDPFGHGVWGSEAANVVDEIAPQPGDYQIYKHRWSAFQGTHLELSLRTAGVDTVCIAGGSTEVGVASTAYQGRDKDFNIVILQDGCRSGRAGIDDYLMEHVFPRLGRVRTVDETIALLKAGATGQKTL